AREPADDRPRRGEFLGGRAASERLGNLQRKVWREPRKPMLELVDLIVIDWTIRQPHGQLIAETIDRVLGAGSRYRRQRQFRPIGKLIGEQAPDDALSGVELAGVDLVRTHLGETAAGEPTYWKAGSFLRTNARLSFAYCGKPPLYGGGSSPAI